jgi:hypothetical protein
MKEDEVYQTCSTHEREEHYFSSRMGRNEPLGRPRHTYKHNTERAISYVNLFSFFLFFVSTGLTVCYSLRLFYYVFCGDFNLSSFYFISESNFNILYGIFGLITVAVFGGG